MNLNRYSNSQDYEFEIFPDDLGFFQRRSFLRSKMSEKSENTLFYMQKNKILSVEVEDDMVGWLQYEKAQFFYILFCPNQKYVLISENDNYFYGYIDGFPCVFKDSYEEAIEVLEEYSEGELVFKYAIGRSSIEYLKIKTIQEVYALLNLSINDEPKYVMEETDSYDHKNISEKIEISNLLLHWKKQIFERELAQKKRSCCFIFAGVIFAMLGYFINHC